MSRTPTLGEALNGLWTIIQEPFERHPNRHYSNVLGILHLIKDTDFGIENRPLIDKFKQHLATYTDSFNETGVMSNSANLTDLMTHVKKTALSLLGEYVKWKKTS